jgi:photosystem II stability/assembly factor-like uncharacterized protein
MRCLAILLLAATALAQKIELSHTTESLRGVSAVSRQIAWASGTHGTYLRTIDAGHTWTSAQVPDATTLDFRAVVAFSADEAFLMSSGPGDQSRIYHTTDAGQHWTLQFTNTNPKGFFDSMAFWDAKHGIVLGDPIPDDSGKLKFEVLLTSDGNTWQQIPSAQLPEALEGEGAFAASNSCIALLYPRSLGADPSPWMNIWFATGGKAARVFHSADHGKTWQVADTPIVHGPESAGIFSVAFRDAMHGVIAGGDYKHPDQDGPNLAFTQDGGKSWALSPLKPQAYFSAVAYDTDVNVKAQWKKPPTPERVFLVGQDFIFDFTPPADPRRISPKKKLAMKFNAISPYPEGGAVIVGAKGAIVTIP